MLFESKYNQISQADGYVRFTRLAVQYENADAMVEESAQLQSAFPPARRSKLCCLRDLRDARGNNDPSFEAILRRTRLQVFKGWFRLAALMKTQLGVLHCQRLFTDLDIVARVTTNEAEAIAHLRNPAHQSDAAARRPHDV